MKRNSFFTILFFCAAVTAFSQEDLSQPAKTKHESEIRTIFAKSKDFKVHVGYFVGPEFAYTQFTGGKDVFLAGISMGVTLDHWFSVGLSGYGIANSGNLYYEDLIYDTATAGLTGGTLYGGYGGLLLEFTVLPRSMVHVSFPVLIGGGGMVYNKKHDVDYTSEDWNWETLDWDAFFVVQPGIRLEFNVVKFFRIGVGASYRYTPDLDLINTSASLINQFNANVSLRFGKF
jgi:hypothetical protein